VTPDDTTSEDLLRAAEIAAASGLSYVYAGNMPGAVADLEDTRCHRCGETLVKRYGYFIEEYRITSDGRCPSCATAIPGRWAEKFDGQIASRPFLPRRASALVSIRSRR